MVYPDTAPRYQVEFTDSNGNFVPETYAIGKDDLTLVWEYDGQ